MCTTRVEVSKYDELPVLRELMLSVPQHVLNSQLGLPIGINSQQYFIVLMTVVSIAIDSGTRTEENVVALVLSHTSNKVEGAHHIVLVIVNRLQPALADCLETSKVDDILNRVALVLLLLEHLL